MLKRLGAAVLIRWFIFMELCFYRIELYQPLASLTILHVIHTYLDSVFWIIAMVRF